MSLTTGRGPLGTDPAGWFSRTRARPAWSSSSPTRAASRASSDGRAVIDTERALLVHRAGQTLTFAFPADEVGDLPSRAGAGGARVRAGALGRGRCLVRGGPQARPLPAEPVPPGRLPADEATSPGEVAGATLVDTDDTLILFETSLPPKLYVAPALVRTDLLRRTETTSYCNYKGVATYWAAVDRRRRRRGRRLELRGPAAREPPHQGLVQLRAQERGGRRRAPPAPGRPRGLRLLPVKPEQERSVPKSRKGERRARG